MNESSSGYYTIHTSILTTNDKVNKPKSNLSTYCAACLPIGIQFAAFH